MEPVTKIVQNSHGKYVFLYRHLQTNQVVYSLFRNLYSSKALKQLVFYGKKTIPSRIRKDLWRPMATVEFAKHALGLHAFQHLRELRMLRDYTWASRGVAGMGNKKERKKKLMDQRGTSVADLVVAIEKANEQAVAMDAKKLQVEQKKHTDWEDLVELAAKLDSGEAAKLDQQFNVMVERHGQFGERGAAEVPKLMMALRIKYNKMLRAKQAVDAVAGIQVPKEQRAKWSTALTNMVEWRMNKIRQEQQEQEQEKEQSKDELEDAEGFNKKYPVTIHWSDIMDAEFARRWPPNVNNQWMGYLRGSYRYFAPDLTMEGSVPVTSIEIPKDNPILSHSIQ